MKSYVKFKKLRPLPQLEKLFSVGEVRMFVSGNELSNCESRGDFLSKAREDLQRTLQLYLRCVEVC